LLNVLTVKKSDIEIKRISNTAANIAYLRFKGAQPLLQ